MIFRLRPVCWLAVDNDALDRCCTLIEVNVLPLQAHGLARAKACEEHEFEWHWVGKARPVLELVQLVEMVLASSRVNGSISFLLSFGSSIIFAGFFAKSPSRVAAAKIV